MQSRRILPTSLPFLSLVLLSLALCCNAQTASSSPSLSSDPPPSRCYLADGYEYSRTILLNEGSGEDFVDLHFVVDPAENIEDIYFVHRSSDHRICATATDSSCVEMSPLLLDSENQIANATLAFEYDRLPGVLDYSLDIYSKSNENSRICSLSLRVVVAGTIIYQGNLTEDRYPPVWSDKTGNRAQTISYTDFLSEPTLLLSVFSQFLDGTNSTTSLLSQPALSDIRILPYVYERQLEFNSESCEPVGLLINGSLSLPFECGIAFGSEQRKSPSNGDPSGVLNDVKMALRFNPYRAGLLGLRFDWPAFTEGHTEIDQLHSFVLEINLIGRPPPVVVDLTPRVAFTSRGGEKISIKAYNTLDLDTMELKVDHIANPYPLIRESRRVDESGFFEIIDFTVTPGTGSGHAWKLHGHGPVGDVRGIDMTGAEVLISYFVLDLTSVMPQQGLATGGTPMLLTGNFESFNRTTDDVLFTNTAIPKNLLTFSSSTNIEFTLPPRLAIGPTYNHEVRVSVGSHRSNLMPFSYYADPIDVTILAVGVSYDTSEAVHVIGRCSPSQFQVIVAPGILIAQYFWKLVDQQSGLDVLSNQVLVDQRNNALVALDGETLSTGNYVLYVEVQSDGGSPGGSYLALKKSPFEQLGVTLYQPPVRSLAFPDAPLRISSFIELPGPCYEGSTRMTFEWSYKDQLHVFSYENGTRTEADTSPLKLGREFVISKNNLVPGDTLVTLRAYMTDHPEVYGLASTMVTVGPGPLIAAIDGGLSSKRISVSSRYVVSGKASYDSATNDTDGLVYAWECEASPDENLETKFGCPAPAQRSGDVSSFNLASSLLVESQQQGIGALRYRLRVSKGDRVSQWTSLVLILTTAVPEPPAIHVTNNRNEKVDLRNVKYFEDTIFTVTGPENLKWQYEILTPSWDREVLLADPENFLTLSGYWQPTRLSREPLGVAKGAFSPGASYTVGVKYFASDDSVAGLITVTITVMETPQLIFPDIVLPNGSPETVFSVTALTSYPSPLFSFYFFLVGDDGSEFCVGGCSGSQTQSFKILRDGKYQVLCRLFDSQGEQLLGELMNRKSITVTNPQAMSSFAARRLQDASARAIPSSTGQDTVASNSDFDVMVMWNTMTDLYESGDHPGFEENAFQIAKSFQKANTSSPDEILFVSDILSKLEIMAFNSVPNPLAGQNYVKIIAEYAKLDYPFVVDDDTVYKLLRVTNLIFENTPKAERLHINDQVRRVFNRTRGHGLNLGSAGTTRSLEGKHSGRVNNLLLDNYELQSRLLTAAATRSEICGFTTTFSTVVADGRPKASSLDHTVVSAYLPCKADQERAVKAEHSTLSWTCDNIFDFSGSKRYVTLIETPDFVYDSGVQGRNASDSLRLTRSSIMKENEDGFLQDIDYIRSSCYDLVVEMSPIPNATQDLAPVLFNMWPPKKWGEPGEEFKSYGSQYDDIQRLTNDGAKSVEVRTGKLGLFGAAVGRDGLAPAGLQTQAQAASVGSLSSVGTILGLLVLVAIVLGALFVGLNGIAGGQVTATGAGGGGAAAPVGYIDRDIYGRSVVGPEYFQQNP